MPITTLSSFIEFPNLGWKFHINDSIHLFGDLSIKWYGLLIAVGFLLAVLYGLKRAEEFGIDPDRMIDVALLTVPVAFVGARLYYVFFSDSVAEYLADPISILKVWEGGLGIYGGIIVAFVFGPLMCKLRKVKIWAMFDLTALGFLIGQSIGRWGNFFNQEAFGGNTDLPWAMTGDIIQAGYNGSGYDPTQPVHPTFLYESLWCILGFVLLHILSKRIVRRFDGMIFCGYMVWYGAGRFAIESLRTDSLMAGTMRTSQLVAILAILLGVVLFFVLRRYSLSLPTALVIAVKDEGDTQEEATEEVEIQAETTPDTTEEDTDGTAN
ncbi:MAG: prolipoprotein diacylglyceryl transferase [Clostridia bacterium]|nr:prolipoprotein diacylglyceryl transferase [Clostridia bacterium]